MRCWTVLFLFAIVGAVFVCADQAEEISDVDDFQAVDDNALKDLLKDKEDDELDESENAVENPNETELTAEDDPAVFKRAPWRRRRRRRRRFRLRRVARRAVRRLRRAVRRLRLRRLGGYICRRIRRCRVLFPYAYGDEQSRRGSPEKNAGIKNSYSQEDEIENPVADTRDEKQDESRPLNPAFEPGERNAD